MARRTKKLMFNIQVHVSCTVQGWIPFNFPLIFSNNLLYTRATTQWSWEAIREIWNSDKEKTANIRRRSSGAVILGGSKKLQQENLQALLPLVSPRHVRENLWEPVILGSRAGAVLIGKVTRGGRRISGHPSDRYLEHTCTHKTYIYISTPVQKLHKV